MLRLSWKYFSRWLINRISESISSIRVPYWLRTRIRILIRLCSLLSLSQEGKSKFSINIILKWRTCYNIHQNTEKILFFRLFVTKKKLKWTLVHDSSRLSFYYLLEFILLCLWQLEKSINTTLLPMIVIRYSEIDIVLIILSFILKRYKFSLLAIFVLARLGFF